MKHHSLIITLAIFLLTFDLWAFEDPDSVKIHTLEEVIVKSERAWIEGEKAVFVPTKSEKNLATDPASLVRNMHIPTLMVSGGNITNISGETVAVYINGVKAEGIDLSTFWPKHTRRVEYMERPTDPRYDGASAVVNFVMTEYVVGGVTKLNGMQNFPNDGRYVASSKLVYKKMTFGAMLRGGYSRDRLEHQKNEETYSDIWYDGEHYDNTAALTERHTISRRDYADVTGNARYTTKNVRITHTLALKWDRIPGEEASDTGRWEPALFSSSGSFSHNRSRVLSPQISGNYYFKLNPKWTLNAAWTYSYAQSSGSYFYRMGDLPSINNGTHEKTNSVRLSINPYYKFNGKVSIALYVSGNMDWYDTKYTGSTSKTQNQKRGQMVGALRFYWRPNRQLYLTLFPELQTYYWKVGDLKHNTNVIPLVSASIKWTPSRRFSLILSPWIRSTNPSASQVSDIIIRQTELLWLAGNPELKPENYWRSQLNMTWVADRLISVGASGFYTRTTNSPIIIYNNGYPDREGLVKTYTNADPAETIGIDGYFSLRMLNDKLSVDLQPTWRRYAYHGIRRGAQSWFRMRGSMDYTFGNCRFSLVYGGEEKWLTNGGQEIVWKADDWNMSFTYGNGNFYLDIGVEDIFHSRQKQRHELSSGDFSLLQDKYGRGRHARLILTYTFGYGKKVGRSIDIDDPEIVKTAVLGSE